VGKFLGPSISRHYRRYPLSWHVDAWAGAGIDDVQVSIMSLGGGLVMWGRKAQGSPATEAPRGRQGAEALATSG
jgi:hypothetical protein